MFKHLFSPIRVGTADVKNRLACLPHGTMFAENGLPSERTLGTTRKRPRAAFRLIVMELSQVHPTTKDMMGLIRGYDKACIAGYRRINDSVHSYDCRIFSQIGHTERQTNPLVSERPLWAPSDIECPVIKTLSPDSPETGSEESCPGSSREASFAWVSGTPTGRKESQCIGPG